PIDCFAQVAQWLIEQHNAQILIYCGPGEEEYNRSLKPLLSTELQASVFDHIKTRSVRELVGLFAHCQLFVGNDTGPRHIAQALDLPLLTIVSPLGHSAIANPVSHLRYRFIDTNHQDTEQEVLNVQQQLSQLWSEVALASGQQAGGDTAPLPAG
ncbi:glycosyltransferase family 9 protein, partial [Aeromonas salmonicida]